MSSKSTSKKVLQSFHARTTLWQIFNDRAKKMECSIDYLINESMRLYAATNGFLVSDEQEMDGAETITDERKLVSTVQAKPPGLPRPGAAPPPPPGSGMLPLPRPGGTGSSAVLKMPDLPRPSEVPRSKEPIRSTEPPAAIPNPTSSSVSMVNNLPRLTLIYKGNKIPIRQEQFIIGRGSKSSDLPIRDSNVSRKHAAVIYHKGAFYIKDLGSTNGVEYGGKQVDSKRIDEGDVFSICGHNFHFTYQEV